LLVAAAKAEENRELVVQLQRALESMLATKSAAADSDLLPVLRSPHVRIFGLAFLAHRFGEVQLLYV
jgi:hypothetical protein